MYQFPHMLGCTIATCGYLWFNAHSSEHNRLVINPKLKENYRESPQLEDQLISDLTHYYQQHTPAQRALQATQVSRSEIEVISLSEFSLITLHQTRRSRLFEAQYNRFSHQCTKNIGKMKLRPFSPIRLKFRPNFVVCCDRHRTTAP